LDTDAVLVRRARDGEFGAFETLFERYRTLVYRFAYQMTSSRTALEQQEASGALDWMTLGNPEDPVGNLEEERRRHALRRALKALPAHHRMMIVLRDMEEREYPEIASMLGCTVGGAKLRVLRARRALKDRIAPLLGEDKT
jgi:RNA polymerase sigma-70 factor (ECF subfamily)